jgi:hypothetical protein
VHNYPPFTIRAYLRTVDHLPRYFDLDCPPDRLGTASNDADRTREPTPLNVESRGIHGRVCFRGSRWQDEVERRATPVVAVGPDPSAMRFDERPADCQAHAAALWEIRARLTTTWCTTISLGSIRVDASREQAAKFLRHSAVDTPKPEREAVRGDGTGDLSPDETRDDDIGYTALSAGAALQRLRKNRARRNGKLIYSVKLGTSKS